MKLVLLWLMLINPVTYIVQDQSSQPNPPAVHSATLKWGASNQKVNYRVWRATNVNGPFTQIKNSIQILTYKDTTVAAGQTYYYKVDCRNPQTNLVSGYSNTVQAVIP